MKTWMKLVFSGNHLLAHMEALRCERAALETGNRAAELRDEQPIYSSVKFVDLRNKNLELADRFEKLQEEFAGLSEKENEPAKESLALGWTLVFCVLATAFAVGVTVGVWI